ncbi:unnamed protein product [Clonostachys rosea]|uniref:SGNH hydrolase-type esterase domain-containing protein n=1 Tax=Bionectria ochroleuca TaxID=29856 RepID=A0ABY6UNP5_BIOOC|nr:unnamed protein product [Clonostachys rosea]
MVFLFQLVAQLLLASTVIAATNLGKVMPLGASITWGKGSTLGNGYRRFLHGSLTDAGYTFTYVGSQTSGSMTNNQNEGFPGLRIGQVYNEHAKADVPKYKPDLYLINLGTNDAVQDFQVDTAGQRMEELIDFLWKTTPNAKVVLSTLIRSNNPTYDDRIVKINAQYRALVAKREGNGKIFLAKMHDPNGPAVADISDDKIHPNDEGFRKMSVIFFDAIKRAYPIKKSREFTA